MEYLLPNIGKMEENIMFRNVQLKYQLFLLISISIIALILIQYFYYHQFSISTKERMSMMFYNLTNQAEQRLLSMNEDIENIAFMISYSTNIQKYILEEDEAHRWDMSDFLQEYLNSMVESNNNILSINIVDRKDRRLSSKSNGEYYILSKILSDYELIEINNKDPFYTNAYIDNKSGEVYYAYVNPIFSISKGYYSDESIGYTIVLCKAQGANSMIENVKLPSKSIFMLVDGSNRIVSSNRTDMRGKKLNNSLIRILYRNSIIEENTEVEYKGEKYLIYGSTIQNTEWKIYSMVKISELLTDIVQFKKKVIFVIFITVILLFSIGHIIIKSITDPVNHIITSLEQIDDLTNRKRIEIKGGNEIAVIGGYINDMLDRTELMTQKILDAQNALYMAQISETRAQISLLQSQINPHFLYNTLECIRSIALYYGVTEIVDISTCMGKIFRYALKEEEIVTIENELECVQDYFTIISIRYGDRFSLMLDVDREILKKNIIKMTLQPLVENAVYHGLEQKRGKGILEIIGYMEEGGNVILEIKDNGKGIAAKELDKINKNLQTSNLPILEHSTNKRSIGLINVNNRIKLNYGKEYGIEVSSEENQGTVVKMTLPR